MPIVVGVGVEWPVRELEVVRMGHENWGEYAENQDRDGGCGSWS